MIRAMFDKLPDLIDPVHSAQHHKRFVSRVNQSQMSRLTELLVETRNDVEIDAEFYQDTVTKFPAFKMQIATVLMLQCQRSLKTFEFPVSSSVQGVFVETLAVADEVPKEIEVFELEDEKISLIELIEEEILLNIPMIPIDESSEMEYQNSEEPTKPPKEKTVTETAEKPNPFAALKQLQHKD